MVGLGLVAVAALGAAKDLHHDAHVDAHLDGHLDGDGAHSPEAMGDWLGWLGALGIGRAPLSVLLQVSLVSFGGGGLLVNAIGRDLLGESGRLLFPVALVVGVAGAVVSLRVAAA